jgi:hypothetical protein
MKVLHIIPGAFNYFDDIKAEAFKLVENLQRMGVDCETDVITYGTWTKREEGAVTAVAPSVVFDSMETIPETLDRATEFDVVHFHAPFLGAAKLFIDWKKNFSNQSLIVTYYRRVKISTLFSIFIYFYNNYYLPKLFASADFVTCSDDDAFKQAGGWRFLKDVNKFMVVDSSATLGGKSVDYGISRDELSDDEAIAYKYAVLYTNLTR